MRQRTTHCGVYAFRLHCIHVEHQRHSGRFVESRGFRAITRKPLTAETIRRRLPRTVHANDVHLRFSYNFARGFTCLNKTHENICDRPIKSLSLVIFNKLIISKIEERIILHWILLHLPNLPNTRSDQFT